jgi:hypothetical protein
MGLQLSRLVLIEKCVENNFPKFPYTEKGLMHCNVFIQGLGGWRKATGERHRKKHIFNSNSESRIFQANQIWYHLKSNNGNRY